MLGLRPSDDGCRPSALVGAFGAYPCARSPAGVPPTGARGAPRPQFDVECFGGPFGVSRAPIPGGTAGAAPAPPRSRAGGSPRACRGGDRRSDMLAASSGAFGRADIDLP